MMIPHSSKQVQDLLGDPEGILFKFQNKYLELIKIIRQSFQKTLAKIAIPADVKNCIDRSIKTQQRLFQQLLNVANRLKDLMSNIKTKDQKKQTIQDYYKKAKQSYDKEDFKHAQFYIDKNQDMVDGTQFYLEHCILKGEILHALKKQQLSNYYLDKKQIIQLNNPETLYTIGLNYQSLGDGEDKKEKQKQKKNKNKSTPSKKINKQYIAKSIQFFKKALSLNPEMITIYQDLSQAYRILGNKEGFINAKTNQAHSISDPSSQSQCYLQLARFYCENGCYQQSLGCYSKSLQAQQDPQNKLTLIYQIVSTIQAGDNNPYQIIPYLEKSLQIIQNKKLDQQYSHNLMFFRLAKYYSRVCQYQKEIELYNYLSKIYETPKLGQNMQINRKIGICYYKMKKYQQAQKYILDDLAINNRSIKDYQLLQQIYMAQEDYLAAKDILLKVSEIDNRKEVFERLLMIQKIVGTPDDINQLSQKLKLFD